MAYNSFINKQVGTQSPKFEFKKDRNNTAIVSGDGLGQFNFMGFDGTTYLETSRIISTSSGTIAANRIGSNLEFYTHPDSAVASTQRMVINSEGNVTINAPVSGTALTIVAGGETITAGDLTITSGNVYLPNTTSTPIGVVFQGGVKFIHTFGTDGCTYIGKNAGSIAASNTSNNTTAVGRNCLTAITTGNGNTGVGDSVLGVCSTQGSNTGMGTRALQQSLGNNNTAIGFRASEGAVGSSAIRNTILGSTCGASISSGGENVYIGFFAALSASTSAQNTVIGSQAFLSATTGANNNVVIGYKAGTLSTGFSQNTIVGTVALDKATTGIYNLALGYGSGTNYTGTESHNILLHSDGVLVDNNTLRIGQSTGAGTRQLNRAFICGIDGVNVGSVAKVLTMASDQIGTATITAGAGISVTPGANTITIATTNGIAWTEVTGTSQAMAVDSGYIANNAGLVTLTLPATAVVGDRVRIAGKGAGGWRCGQNAGQTINFGNTATTAGVAGYIDSTNQYDALELLCITANTTWVALSSVGNLNVV
jgi:hypothetical protein